MAKNIILTICMLIFTSINQAQTSKKIFHRFYFNAGYIFSSNMENIKPNRPLFAGNGVQLGLAHAWGWSSRFGITTNLSYSSGSIHKTSITKYMNDIQSPIPLTYNTSNNKWNQFELRPGIMFHSLFNIPLFVEISGGIAYRPNPNSITIQQNDNGTLGKTMFNVTENKFSPSWGIRAFYTISNLKKKTHAYVGAGISTTGYVVTASSSYASSNCVGMPCCRCGLAGCNPCAAEAASKKSKK